MVSLFGGLTALTLFGSFFWMAVLLVVLLIALFASEVEEQGGIAFIGVVTFLVLNYYWGNVPVMKFISWASVLGYLGVGLLFTIVRVFFYGREMAIKGNKFDVWYLKNHVFRWWFIWPISLLVWIFSDLLSDLWNFIYERLGHTFEYFMKLGYDSVKTKK